MNRRNLLRGMAALAGGHALLPLPSHAQPAATYRVVIRMPGSVQDQRDFGWVMSERLGEAMRKLGYGARNLELVDQPMGDSLQVTAAQLAVIRARRTDAIVSYGQRGTLLLREAVGDLPIVAWGVEDPVSSGLATSFTRPGGNVTGLTQGKEGVYARQVDFLSKAVPGLSGIAVFGYRGSERGRDVARQFGLLDAVIADKGFRSLSVPTVGPRALDAMPGLNARGYQAAIYFDNPSPLGRETQRVHAAQAIRHRVAALGYFANLADDGFLASYGELDADLFHRLALQLDRVLRGMSPAAIPFMHPQRYHLRVNRRTAGALGLALGHDVRLMADELVD